MNDPATELTRHDETHGHYTDRPTLHDQLTAALHTVLVDLHQPEVGHSLTGDVRHLHDDAAKLAAVAEKTVGDVWEHGRKHGLRQAWRPHDARVKQLEEEIESMLTIEEGNDRAFQLKCERVRELEAKLAAVRKIHTPVHGGPDNGPTCRACRTAVWPCPTLQAAE